jgi:hypothetical protein
MTMRVLHALQELDYGGAESITALLVDGARQAGIDVAVAAAPGPFEDAFPVRRFNLPIIRRAPIALMRAARAHVAARHYPLP